MTADAWDGRPLNPERDGWHWLHFSQGNEPWFWSSSLLCWGAFPDFTRDGIQPARIALEASYLGPALLPAEVAAAVLAERAACGAACDAEAQDWREMKQFEAVMAIIQTRLRINALPAPAGGDALAAALAQARREGIEAAAVWHEERAKQLRIEGWEAMAHSGELDAAAIRALLPAPDAALADAFMQWHGGKSDE